MDLLVRIQGPDKLQTTSEALVSPSERRINDILAVTTDNNKPSVGAVLEGLWVHFTAAEVLGRVSNTLAILRVIAYSMND